MTMGLTFGLQTFLGLIKVKSLSIPSVGRYFVYLYEVETAPMYGLLSSHYLAI